MNTRGFKKDMKKVLFQVLEFQIAQEATFRDSACPHQIEPVGGKWAIAYF